MKKLLLLLAAILICYTSQAQVKKKTPIKKTPVRLTEIQQIKKNALSWFKNVYVDSYFKDPYSYKVLKCDIYPVNNEEALKSAAEDLSYAVERLDTLKSYSDYGIKKRQYHKAVNNIKVYPTIYSQTDVDKAKKAWDDEILKYNQALSDKKETDSLLLVIDANTRKKVSYYMVYLDCYSNNSYGNPVLGKYSFYFDKNGLVRDPIQLNSED